VAGFLDLAEAAGVLRWLTGAIISGHGSRQRRSREGHRPATFSDFVQRNARAWLTSTAR